MISIELDDEEAKLFRDFRMVQDDFEKIKNAGAFGGLDYGKISLNIANGQIINIVVEQRTFMRRSLTKKGGSIL